MFLLEWMNLAFLAQYLLERMGGIASAFGAFLTTVLWNANGNDKMIDLAAQKYADAVAQFLMLILEGIIAYAIAKGQAKALKMIKNSWFGKQLGIPKLQSWLNQQLKARQGKPSTSSLENRGYRPKPGERSTTREQWQNQERGKRLAQQRNLAHNTKWLSKHRNNVIKKYGADGMKMLSEGVIAKRVTKEGHTLKVLSNGKIVRCSTCGELAKEFAQELNGNKKLSDWLKNVQKRATENPEGVADEIAIIEKQLQNVRKSNSKFSDNIQKSVQKMIDEAQYSNHGNKHLKAKTEGEAKKFSDQAAQYLPGLNNANLEKTALLEGTRIERGGGTFWSIYRFNDYVGFDGGEKTRWIRAEYSSGTYHGHPISIERVSKYITNAQP
ncbi:MAG: hypothetical protein HEQ14_19910 [Aphanizomenon flos-aquae CP01]|jgi:hypothetical protein|nr:hypothetical protein [Aphanizomenon flos-aquae CP01]